MTGDDRPWQAALPDPAGTAEAAQRSPAAQTGAGMERCLIFGRVIDTLSRGPAFQAWFSRILRIAAAGIAFAGLIAFFRAWQFTGRQEAAGILGGICYMLFLVAGIYMATHAVILRAGRIASLPEDGFPLLSLCAVLSLLLGEAYAAFSASVSVGGGVLIWFTRGGASELLTDVSAFVPAQRGSDFLAGILFMIRGLVRAVAVLTAGYLASELLVVIRNIGERPQPIR